MKVLKNDKSFQESRFARKKGGGGGESKKDFVAIDSPLTLKKKCGSFDIVSCYFSFISNLFFVLVLKSNSAGSPYQAQFQGSLAPSGIAFIFVLFSYPGELLLGSLPDVTLQHSYS